MMGKGQEGYRPHGNIEIEQFILENNKKGSKELWT